LLRRPKVIGSAMLTEGGKKVEALVFLGFLVVWVVLQVWVLPKLGVKT
jgi:hypothetical protein